MPKNLVTLPPNWRTGTVHFVILNIKTNDLKYHTCQISCTCSLNTISFHLFCGYTRGWSRAGVYPQSVLGTRWSSVWTICSGRCRWSARRVGRMGRSWWKCLAFLFCGWCSSWNEFDSDQDCHLSSHVGQQVRGCSFCRHSEDGQGSLRLGKIAWIGRNWRCVAP